MSLLRTPSVLPEFQFGSHPHLVILYFYLISYSRSSSIWKLGTGLWCTCQTLYVSEPLNWGSCFWWVDSRSKTTGVGDSYAVHFGGCLQIALQRAHHYSHFHQEDVKWPFLASPWGFWNSWSLILQHPRSASSLPGVWGTHRAGLGLLAAHGCWSHPRMQAEWWRQDLSAGRPAVGAGSWTWDHAGDVALATLPEGQLVCWNESRGRRRDVPLKCLLLHLFSRIVEYQEYYGYCADLFVFWLSHLLMIS